MKQSAAAAHGQKTCLLSAAIGAEQRTFDELPFSDVDAAVFAEISRFSFAGAPSARNADAPWPSLSALMTEGNIDSLRGDQCFWSPRHDGAFVRAVGQSPRYGAACVGLYASRRSKPGEPAKQFAAVTFRLADGSSVIAFRGTDLTLDGWKEDFGMLFEPILPSQREAHVYLERVAACVKGSFHLVGHSKGGLLAEHAALHAAPKTGRRIASVHNLDGPGPRTPASADSAYRIMSGRLRKVIPCSSFYGLLFCDASRCRVVRASGIGLQAHQPGLWRIDAATGEFASGEVSPCALHVAARLQAWLEPLSHDDRRRFVDSAFAVASASGATTITEAAGSLVSHPTATMRAWRALPIADRKLLRRTISSLGMQLAVGIMGGLRKNAARRLGRGLKEARRSNSASFKGRSLR